MIYVNEIDQYCVQWLQNLMDAGVLPPGHIDTRSIEDVTPNDLAGYTQCHFFAGLGGWIYALDLAGWPRDRPVWTGSCPCQPFSAAGKGAGFADERHLWPAWQHLIAQRKPATVFGEQVASKDADAWIDLVHADMEGMGYAFGCIPFPATGIGAPHVRDRNYWVAHADGRNASAEREQRSGQQRQQPAHGGAGELADSTSIGWIGRRTSKARDEPAAVKRLERLCDAGRLADANGGQQQGVAVLRGNERNWQDAGWPQGGRGAAACGEHDGLADAKSIGRGRRQGLSAWRDDDREVAWRGEGFDGPSSVNEAGLPRGLRPGPVHGFWRAADWLACTDGKWRPVEPGTFPLAHGIPGRVGRLRAYGNAIVPQAAAEFVAAFMEQQVRQSLAAA